MTTILAEGDTLTLARGAEIEIIAARDGSTVIRIIKGDAEINQEPEPQCRWDRLEDHWN